jgi:signal transduction histidine kinase
VRPPPPPRLPRSNLASDTDLPDISCNLCTLDHKWKNRLVRHNCKVDIAVVAVVVVVVAVVVVADVAVVDVDDGRSSVERLLDLVETT